MSKYWERSTNNKYCRELTLNDDICWWTFIYEKATNRLIVSHQDLSKLSGETQHRNTPNIPIKDLEWLINGEVGKEE